jgi:hypothetical protein
LGFEFLMEHVLSAFESNSNGSSRKIVRKIRQWLRPLTFPAPVGIGPRPEGRARSQE